MACLLDIKTLSVVSNRLSENNDTVVLTHGAFDLFHIGHASLLKESKKRGDFFIVGLDSDERIVKYKKQGRPVIPLEQRIKIVLENKSVDFVFPIDDSPELSESYYIRLYRTLTPKVVTCGKSFSYLDEFVKRNRYYGLSSTKFSVVRHPYEDIQSTTKIIHKIKTEVSG